MTLNIDRMRKHAGMPARPRGSVIEIFERASGTDPLGTIVPNRVRVNGYEMLLTDDPITIGPLSPTNVATVNMTIFARKVTVTRETVSLKKTPIKTL